MHLTQIRWVLARSTNIECSFLPISFLNFSIALRELANCSVLPNGFNEQGEMDEKCYVYSNYHRLHNVSGTA